MKNAGISSSDIDRVPLASLHDPLIDIADPSTVHGTTRRVLAGASKLERSLPKRWGVSLWQLYRATAGRLHLRDRIRLVSRVLDGYPENRTDVVEHHTAHAYTAYYGSPFRNDAVVLTVDIEGDGLCATVSIVENGLLRRVASTPYAYSIGWIYLAATQFLGTKPNEHEHKVMGLAPYAYPSDTERAFDYKQSISAIAIQSFGSVTNG